MWKLPFNLDYWQGLIAGMAIMYFAMRKRSVRPSTAICPVAGDDVVTSVLKPVRQQYDMPSMAAAVVTSGGLLHAGAVGVRKRGTEFSVGIEDRWHLGSNTKAMTAALIARLVERRQLQWDSTLDAIFPELAAEMHPQFGKVTMLHLLAHRAGVRGNLNIAEYRGADGPALRLRAAQEELSLSPGYPPGTRYAYSNLGYIIVGAAVERLTGATWEEAIARELFEPLEMGSTGFRGTGTPGEIDQPWPHTSNGQPAPINGPDTDNPAVMSPAGGVNCTIQDWARFIRDQLRGARGEPALLNAGSYEVLHTPPFGGNYALGWIVAERGWAGGKAFNHGGDNTMNFANVWIAPARDFAILVCANQGGKTAFQATDAAVMGLSGTVARRQLSP